MLDATVKISKLMVLLATVGFTLGGTLSIMFFPDLFFVVFTTSICAVVLSIPFTIAGLVLACKEDIIGGSYVFFAILFSCFIAGLGWLVIPFMLNKDIKSHESQFEKLKLLKE